MTAATVQQRDGKHRGAPPVPSLQGLQRLREPAEDSEFLRLHRNERLSSLPSWFLERIRAALQSELLTRYPSTDAVYAVLSASVQLAAERLLLTAGSDAAVKALYQAYVRPGDAVVMLDPSYAMYGVYARMFAARARPVPFSRSLELDPSRLLAQVVPGVRLVLIANPNQPTGTMLKEPLLRRLLERAEAAGALLVIDEAYAPFARTTLLPWAAAARHLVILRSFSKAAGLAGLRIGFVAADPEVIANLYKVRSVHDINSVALACAAQILSHPELVDLYVDEVEAGRRLLVARATALGCEPLPSCANFLLIRVARRCEPLRLVEALRRRGVLVKGPFDHPSLAECIRVTLGPPDVMAAFADILGAVLGEDQARAVSPPRTPRRRAANAPRAAMAQRNRHDTRQVAR